ncbi:MAG: phosphotransferase, partial [Candidatus Margulisiibacteriota bacterium]
MKPEIDLKEHWPIAPQKVTEFQGPGKNPFKDGHNIEWVIDNKYFLHSYPPDQLASKQKEHYLLTILKALGVPVLQPINDKLVQGKKRLYELVDYIPQDQTSESSYRDLSIAQAGELADVLNKVSKVKSSSFDDQFFFPFSSIKENIAFAKHLIKSRNSEIQMSLQKAETCLQKRLFPFLPYCEPCFCHGDLHPANILWQKEKIRAMIDWEIAHYKEELYDLAFVLSCIGMDNPENLKSPAVRVLIVTYFKNSKRSKLAFALLPEILLATRIQWLAVWLAGADDFAVALQETAYWNWLWENMDDLRRLWHSWLDLDFKYSAARWVVQDQGQKTELDKAKQKLSGLDLFGGNLLWEVFQPVEEFTTNLRFLAIDAGSNDDVVKLIQVLELQKKLLNAFPENDHIKIERSITLGNALLDFSKFRMLRAAQHIAKECE